MFGITVPVWLWLDWSVFQGCCCQWWPLLGTVGWTEGSGTYQTCCTLQWRNWEQVHGYFMKPSLVLAVLVLLGCSHSFLVSHIIFLSKGKWRSNMLPLWPYCDMEAVSWLPWKDCGGPCDSGTAVWVAAGKWNEAAAGKRLAEGWWTRLPHCWWQVRFDLLSNRPGKHGLN